MCVIYVLQLRVVMQGYVSRLAGLLEVSSGNEHSPAGKQVEVRQSLLHLLGHWFSFQCNHKANALRA